MMNNSELLSRLISSTLSSVPHIIPELILLVGFLLLVLTDLFIDNKKLLAGLSFTVVAASFVALFFQLSRDGSLQLFQQMLVLDNRTVFFKMILGLGGMAAFVPLLNDRILSGFGKRSAEFYVLFPAFMASLFFLSMADHLLSIYLSIEFVSICSYFYVAYFITEKRNAESSVKYILFGAISSAIMLYGISLLYGFTGTLSLQNGQFLAMLSKVPVAYSTVALMLILSGFLYKITAAPFHFYAPDVYEGTRPLVLIFMSTLPKIAGLSVFFSFTGHFAFQLSTYHVVWPNFNWEKVLSVIAIATLFIGNLSALAQKNLNRLMAYSSIGHTGFLLMSLVVFSSSGTVSLLYYSLVYLLMNIGVFYILHLFSERYNIQYIDELKGLFRTAPYLSVVFVVLLASLTGLPPFAGFIAKFLVFSAVFEGYTQFQSPWLMWLLVAGVLNTVIALFYYFKIALYLFFRKAETEHQPFHFNVTEFVLLAIVLAVVLLGIFPSALIGVLNSYLPGKALLLF